jgi:hypothetical protein
MFDEDSTMAAFSLLQIQHCEWHAARARGIQASRVALRWLVAVERCTLGAAHPDLSWLGRGLETRKCAAQWLEIRRYKHCIAAEDRSLRVSSEIWCREVYWWGASTRFWRLPLLFHIECASERRQITVRPPSSLLLSHPGWRCAGRRSGRIQDRYRKP